MLPRDALQESLRASMMPVALVPESDPGARIDEDAAHLD
jgi:hypothetical protein